MSKKKKHASDADEAVRLCETIAENLGLGESCGRAAGESFAAGPFTCGTDAGSSSCAGCPSQNAATGRCASQETVIDCGASQAADPVCEEKEEPLAEPTEEERTAILALDHASVSRLLRAEEPLTVAVATEFIVFYSLKVAEALRQSNEFHHVMQPTPETSAVECIAMDIVRNAVTSSLEMEASGLYA